MTNIEPPRAAEISEAAERAAFDAWAVRDGSLPTSDTSWWHIHRSGPTHTKYIADAVLAAVEPLLREQIADEIEAKAPGLSGNDAQWHEGLDFAVWVVRGGA